MTWPVWVPRQVVPLVLTTIRPGAFTLFYLEIQNATAGPITFSAVDMAGLSIIPPQAVQGNAILTYEAKYGAPANGLRWLAAAPGLTGWFCGGN